MRRPVFTGCLDYRNTVCPAMAIYMARIWHPSSGRTPNAGMPYIIPQQLYTVPLYILRNLKSPGKMPGKGSFQAETIRETAICNAERNRLRNKHSHIMDGSASMRQIDPIHWSILNAP